MGNYVWLAGYSARKLHAAHRSCKQWTPHVFAEFRAICGNYVTLKPYTEWAKERVKNGLPKCRMCEKMIAKGGEV